MHATQQGHVFTLHAFRSTVNVWLTVRVERSSTCETTGAPIHVRHVRPLVPWSLAASGLLRVCYWRRHVCFCVVPCNVFQVDRSNCLHEISPPRQTHRIKYCLGASNSSSCWPASSSDFQSISVRSTNPTILPCSSMLTASVQSFSSIVFTSQGTDDRVPAVPAVKPNASFVSWSVPSAHGEEQPNHVSVFAPFLSLPPWGASQCRLRWPFPW